MLSGVRICTYILILERTHIKISKSLPAELNGTAGFCTSNFSLSWSLPCQVQLANGKERKGVFPLSINITTFTTFSTAQYLFSRKLRMAENRGVWDFSFVDVGCQPFSAFNLANVHVIKWGESRIFLWWQNGFHEEKLADGVNSEVLLEDFTVARHPCQCPDCPHSQGLAAFRGFHKPVPSWGIFNFYKYILPIVCQSPWIWHI